MAKRNQRERTAAAETAFRSPNVEVFAYNLDNPSHMEWTNDGRLLVSEHTSGQVTDITEGGDMQDADPFAEGLEGPSSMLPLDDGRLLISEAFGGRVTDISSGGDFSDDDGFAQDLSRPYSVVNRIDQDGKEHVQVTEKHETASGALIGTVTDITEGGSRENFEAYLNDIPVYEPPVGTAKLPDGDDVMTGSCSSWETVTMSGKRVFLSISPLGQILDVTDAAGKSYGELLEDEDRLVADDLHHTGGLKYNSRDGLIYGVEPYEGTVFAADPDGEGHNKFSPGVTRNLNGPSCLRFGSDDEMYVCGRGEGVILKVTDYK